MTKKNVREAAEEKEAILRTARLNVLRAKGRSLEHRRMVARHLSLQNRQAIAACVLANLEKSADETV